MLFLDLCSIFPDQPNQTPRTVSGDFERVIHTVVGKQSILFSIAFHNVGIDFIKQIDKLTAERIDRESVKIDSSPEL